jgi:flagellar biosynthesis GTPase FlhF
MAPEDQQTFTYRGRSLEELVPRIRQELGDDAVIVSRRETTSGGVGGFFAKREIEVEVRAGENSGPPTPAVAAAFAAQLAEAHERQASARPMTSPEVDALPGSANVTVDDLFPAPPPSSGGGLAALFNAGLPPAELEPEPEPVAPEPEPVARREIIEDDEEFDDDEWVEQDEPAPVAELGPVEQPTGMFDYLGVGEQEPQPEHLHEVDPLAPTSAAPSVPEPVAAEPEPELEAEPEPEAVEPEPVEPFAFALEAEPVEPEPESFAVEPEPEPVAVEPEPDITPLPEPEPEPDHVAPEPDPAPEPIALVPAPAPVAGLPPAALIAAERLVARGLRASLAEAIAHEAIAGLAPLLPGADPKELVTDALARRIPMHPLRSGPGVIGFVGPGGAGKTRCVARLAAAHARHGTMPVSVIALRSPDGGAELRRLLAPYGVALHAVESGAEGAARIAGLRGEGLVIVDTPGVSPRSTGELRSLGLELDALAPDELHLAVPATIGPAAAQELVGGVRELGVGALVLTHTDETEMLGTVVGLAIDSGLPLSYLARGQAVEAGLRPASATELARDLVP